MCTLFKSTQKVATPAAMLQQHYIRLTVERDDERNFRRATQVSQAAKLRLPQEHTDR